MARVVGGGFFLFALGRGSLRCHSARCVREQLGGLRASPEPTAMEATCSSPQTPGASSYLLSDAARFASLHSPPPRATGGTARVTRADGHGGDVLVPPDPLPSRQAPAHVDVHERAVGLRSAVE